MFDTVRYESRRRLPASAVLAGSLAGFAGMVLLIAPGVVDDVDMDAILDQLPPAFVEGFGLEALGTVEGFIAIELYQFIWLIGLGAYVAYSAAGTIAGDIDTGRLDGLLAAPIARWQLLVEKFLALLTPIVVVNVVVFFVVFGGSHLIEEPINLTDLAMVHLLSVPYLLACAAFGMVASVVASRRLLAEGVGAGAIIGTFLLQSVVSTTDYEWVGAVAPMRYYDPLTILTASEYDFAGAAILAAATVAFLFGGSWWFTRRDIQ